MRYTKSFFSSQQADSKQSAYEVVPMLIELFQPQSVLDVGCGTGTWLAVFKEHGVNRILGLDGDYVPHDMLLIEPDEFEPIDLNEPPQWERRFDLAISLEVGEHLPLDSASKLVDLLTSAANVIAFSAAIPLQGGRDHINEQWQSFWANLFQERGYKAYDVIRPRVWTNEKVAGWYRQNFIVYAHPDRIGNQLESLLQSEANLAPMLDIVHPYLLVQRNQQPFFSALSLFKWIAYRSAVRLRGLFRV